MSTDDATLAIDPGKRAGYSVWHKGALTAFGHLPGDTAKHPAQLIDHWEPVKLAVEDFYVDFRRRQKGWKTMAYRALLWRALAEARGISVQVVTSMAWQAWAKVKRGDKDAIGLVAAAFVGDGMAAPGPDETDAILIGAYATTTGGSET